MNKLPKIQLKKIGLRKIFTIISFLLLIPLVVFVLPTIKVWQARAAATIYWDGGGDGTSWADPLNWNTDLVPVPADEVLIDTSSTVNIVEPITVTSLTLGKSDGTAASILQFSYDAVTLGALTITGTELRVYNGATIRHIDYNGVVPAKVNINVQTGDALILGSINADSRGYRSTDGPGQGTDTDRGAGGGAHGGNGGIGQEGHAGGTGYGSYTQPTDFGSGGGIRPGNASSNHGGGAIKLTVGGTLTVTGTITANGGYGDNGTDRKPGGGAGGSIWITTGTLSGSGHIRANGGGAADNNYDGGGGGGGRVAIYYTTNNSTLAALSANGGSSGIGGSAQYGGAGTLLMKQVAQTNGDLTISSNATGWSTDISKVATTVLPSSLTLDNFYISKFGRVDYSSTVTVATLTEVSYSGHFNLTGTANLYTLNINNNGWFYSGSTATTTYNSVTWTGGIITDNGGTMTLLSGGGNLTVPTGSTFYANTPRTFTNITVDGTITHNTNYNTPVYKIDLTSTGDLAVNFGGQINIDSRGYYPGEGPGAGVDADYGASGGGHGGNGGNGQSGNVGGTAYGSFTQPTDLGSGGGLRPYYWSSIYGGGAVKLTVSGTTTINGTITANGGYADNSTDRKPGGGAGGSVWITTGTLAGTGIVRANGGGSADSNYDGGGGGGGRVALYYTTDNSNLSTLSAKGGRPGGGAQYGGAGTIYTKAAAATYGDLRIDNDESSWDSSVDKVANTPITTNVTLTNLTIADYGRLDYANTMTITSGLGLSGRAHLRNSGVINADDITISTNGWYVSQGGSTTTYNSLAWTGGIITDNGGTMNLLSVGGDLVIPAGSYLHGNVQRTFTNLTIHGVLTHTENGSTAINKLNYTITEDLTVSASGSINVDSRGHSPSEGTGAGSDTDQGAGGGGHGGKGGNGQTGVGIGGNPYGDAFAPDTIGSGGGYRPNYWTGAYGGGAIKMDVGGTATINGVITANGGYGTNGTDRTPGGGAGGSVWIIADVITGTGLIRANGGDTHDWGYDGGGGGGGRIALYYKQDTSAFTAFTVNGGNSASGQDGSVGTTFLGGIPTDPINMMQFKVDGVTGIGAGGSTNENSIKLRFQLMDGNDSDTLTPEVEFVPLGTTFNNVATNTGVDVSYSGSAVTAEVEVTGLADGSSYHWQARACDISGLCSDWTSYGNNTEAEADVRVVMNADPNSPTIPESSFYINAQYTNNLQPTLGFVIIDSNTIDSVGYQIQIATDVDFTEIITDYTSAMAAQGTQSFTVGQAVGDGTYTVGNELQELTTDDYYWRVKAIDDKGADSDWTLAVGTPSFRIDLSKPSNATDLFMKAHAGATNEYMEGAEDIWFRRNDLYFSWVAGADTQGVKGYCVYIGDDPNGDPATEKGLLGSSPISTSGTTCQFITDQTEIDFSNSALRSYEWLTSSNSKYYFKVKTIDVANNVYEGPDISNFVSFNFDNTPPQNVIAVSTPSIVFSSAADMFFNWTTGGAGASDDHSQVLGFQYALNSRDTWWGNTIDDFTGVSYSPMDREQPLYLPEEVQALVQLGQNTVYFRVVDHAGNYSELRTAVLNYGGEAPKFAQGDEITVTPTQNTTNRFAFSWPEATASQGNTVATYYYMINTPPPVSYATITSNSATYIATTETSLEEFVVPGLRKGANTIYVAVVDQVGNYSPTNVLSATFYLNSELPDSPQDVTVADISIKDVSIWRAAVVWNEPEYKGTGTLTYHVYRSEDGETWEEISTTTGLTYVDTVPESKEYFWRVATTDNSDESIASPSISNGVSLVPRGKYLVPPDLTSGPASSSISTTKATISWTTSRIADSKVAFGLESNNYFESESYNSSEVTEHKIVLNNLTPGTTYYYTAKWTDEDGNTGSSEEMTFITEPAPEVKDVRISNRGISGAIINFTTVKASSVKIYYGTSTNFGGVKEIATSKLETSYALELNQLQDGTKYYYKINTLDEEGKEYEGTTLDFTTMPRPRVYNIRVQQVAKTAQSTLLVTWDSNTAISSVVTYYPSSNPELMRDNVAVELLEGEHEMLVKGLFPDTEYIIQVRGKDIIGNEAVSEVIKIRTSRDSRAPQISGMTLEGTNVTLVDGGTSSQLIVSWNTDEPATSQVEYGEGSGEDYNQLTQEDKDLSYNHVVIISGLTPSKVYHLRAISMDSAGNISKSIDTVTITPKATDNALYLVITTLREAFGFLDNL